MASVKRFLVAVVVVNALSSVVVNLAGYVHGVDNGGEGGDVAGQGVGTQQLSPTPPPRANRSFGGYFQQGVNTMRRTQAVVSENPKKSAALIIAFLVSVSVVLRLLGRKKKVPSSQPLEKKAATEEAGEEE
ncbi:unnamed protein product [Neospora caninum Liverpool]|uniref:Dense granule protein GRA5 n=1 Tax=Neospora caninum (strain Liverpool) TaxID=572307 RepID=F0VDA6_NEOCL|nr:uncharacterized protein NCLIV_014150 [Neospora caninum Liverpool]CBZ51621.1 unnamed protein product [Neospora caninum Liverpool]CEL65575.1 TPA: hypothetical protein BN1204_014150 [Neospora caninum Liverpool]|eukprot:XP_003881654.1 uncharacterized protein NCLIV_014150 [Neospora caninum Liverpool]